MVAETEAVGWGRRPPFELQVLLYSRAHLRDDNLNMEMYVGLRVLEGLFDRMEEQPDVTDLFLSFPERFLNILEQRALYRRLERYCPNLKSVQIKTHSVYIIQCTANTCCGIVDSAVGIDEKDEGKLYVDVTPTNIFKRGGITVLPGGTHGAAG